MTGSTWGPSHEREHTVDTVSMAKNQKLDHSETYKIIKHNWQKREKEKKSMPWFLMYVEFWETHGRLGGIIVGATGVEDTIRKYRIN